MTLSDQAAMTGQDGRVTEERPSRPKRRTFTAAYKARIVAAFDALAEGSPERGALLRKERLYHSHIEHWRKQQEKGTLTASTGKPKTDAADEELARLRAENKKLKATNEKLAGQLGKTKSALEIAGKYSRCWRTSQAARTAHRLDRPHLLIQHHRHSIRQRPVVQQPRHVQPIRY